jgi:DNA-binding MarR family transcriptional regulator
VKDTEGLETEIVTAIRRIMRAVELRSREIIGQCGVTGPQLVVLQAVAKLENGSVTTIARNVHLGHATVTRILTRLENRKLVERTRGSGDRRTVHAVLTERGKETVANAPSLLQDEFREELAKLEDWEQTTLLSSLQRVATMMDAESLPAEPLLTTSPVAAKSEGAAGSDASESAPAGKNGEDALEE